MRNSILFLFVAILTVACTGKKPSAPVSSSDPEEVIPVSLHPVNGSVNGSPLKLSGIVTSRGEQRLSFKTGGIIRRIYADEGDQVRAGQLLAELDKTEIDAQVQQAKEGLAKAERDLGRVQGLYRDSSATLELLQNATTARDVAAETVRIAAFNQKFSEIRAGKSGKIIKKLSNEGELTGPGMPVLVLFETGPDDWVVRVAVSDRDWARLSAGTPARITLDAWPGEVFSGKVTELAPSADPANGLYQVEFSIQARGKRLAPGLFATLEVAPPKNIQQPAIPIEAIVEGDGSAAYVYVLNPDSVTVRKVPVVIDRLEKEQAIIASGLNNIDAVITSGTPYLTEKKKVKVFRAAY
ncbi:MAG: efflux RND transporter periplasmic adaptor subunit [Bacteroidota bacterium]|jgi:multidrug efflux system membrane fusion protein